MFEVALRTLDRFLYTNGDSEAGEWPELSA
jgi:hypothetical protein